MYFCIFGSSQPLTPLVADYSYHWLVQLGDVKILLVGSTG